MHSLNGELSVTQDRAHAMHSLNGELSVTQDRAATANHDDSRKCVGLDNYSLISMRQQHNMSTNLTCLLCTADMLRIKQHTRPTTHATTPASLRT